MIYRLHVSLNQNLHKAVKDDQHIWWKPTIFIFQKLACFVNIFTINYATILSFEMLQPSTISFIHTTRLSAVWLSEGGMVPEMRRFICHCNALSFSGSHACPYVSSNCNVTVLSLITSQTICITALCLFSTKWVNRRKAVFWLHESYKLSKPITIYNKAWQASRQVYPLSSAQFIRWLHWPVH